MCVRAPVTSQWLSEGKMNSRAQDTARQQTRGGTVTQGRLGDGGACDAARLGSLQEVEVMLTSEVEDWRRKADLCR